MMPSVRAHPLERIQRFVIGDGDILGPPDVFEVGMFRADAGIVQARRNAVRRQHLPVIVLKHIRRRPVQDAFAARRQRRRVFARVDAPPRRLHADQPHALVMDKRVENAHRIGPAADTGDNGIGQAAHVFQ